MRSIRFALGAAVMAVAALASLSATAAPQGALGSIKPVAGEQSLIEQAHGWHRSCRRGFTDVHRHIRGVGRVSCTTRRCWKNKWGFRRCRWY